MAGWLRQIGWAKLEFAFGLANPTSPAAPKEGVVSGRNACSHEGPKGGPGPVLLRVAGISAH